MAKDKILGKGLKELFSENAFSVDDVREGEVIVDIDLGLIKPNPYQPRKVFNQEKINELAQSIKEHGVFQPIIVKATNSGYIIVSGERRFRASQQVGRKTVPAIVRSYDNSLVQEIALLENLQREDLSPIEEAEAYKNLIENLNYTQQNLSERIGKSRSYVTNMLGLLILPSVVQEMISGEKISMGHARVLSKLKDQSRIMQLAEMIIKKNLSVRELENLAQGDQRINEIKKAKKDPGKSDLEKRLKTKYGFDFKISNNSVTIKENAKGSISKWLANLLEDTDVQD